MAHNPRRRGLDGTFTGGKGDRLEFGPDTVRKTFEITPVDDEAAKAQEIHRIAVSTGLFVAPEVIEVSSEDNSLVMRRVDFRAVYPLAMPAEFPRCLGQGLAAIHSHLGPTRHVGFVGRATHLGSADRLRQVAPSAWAHGDFGLANVGVAPGSQPVVFDSSPNLYTSFAVWSYQPVLLDVGVLLSSVVARSRTSALLRSSNARTAAARFVSSFLAGYADGSGITLAIDDVRFAVRHVLQRYYFGFRYSRVAPALLAYCVGRGTSEDVLRRADV
jgi:hypothetical protein